ncbi:MAG: hypothetical protein GX308_01320 [Epulopiscium sp.]|nr:hypothetical protein [Candidatus Epulonipiscium sp.]
MRKIKKLLGCLLSTILILQCFDIPMMVYADTLKEVKFNEVVNIKNTTLQTQGENIGSQSISSHCDMWRHSGGYWRYTDDGTTITITDEEASSVIFGGTLNKTVPFARELPQKVKDFLAADPNNINKLQIKITSKDKDPANIYNSAQWKIENGKMFIQISPKFNFLSSQTITQRFNNRGMSVAIPVVDPNFGSNIYSMYSKTGGTNYGAAKKLESILKDSNGNLEPYNPVTIIAGAYAGKPALNSQDVKSVKGHLVVGEHVTNIIYNSIESVKNI